MKFSAAIFLAFLTPGISANVDTELVPNLRGTLGDDNDTVNNPGNDGVGPLGGAPSRSMTKPCTLLNRVMDYMRAERMILSGTASWTQKMLVLASLELLGVRRGTD